MERINAWKTYDAGTLKSCMDFADDYKEFLDQGKTERECIDRFVNEAEANGYIELNEAVREGKKLSAGDRGMGEVMGQKLSMTVEITDSEGASPHAHKVNMSIPYNMDGITINIPALMAGLPEDAYLSEFEILAPAEDEEGTDEANPDDMGTEEFEMGDI